MISMMVFNAKSTFESRLAQPASIRDKSAVTVAWDYCIFQRDKIPGGLQSRIPSNVYEPFNHEFQHKAYTLAWHYYQKLNEAEEES